MIVAFTGHRPKRLKRTDRELANDIQSLLAELQPDTAIIGMAQGFDQVAGLVALSEGIPYIAAVPFKNHMDRGMQYPIYKQLIENAKLVHIVSEGGWANYKYIIRDKWMVDNSDILIAGFDEVQSGGTWATIDYAQTLKRTIYYIPVLPVPVTAG